jgi:DNA-binding MarR family transcriptional regulator
MATYEDCAQAVLDTVPLVMRNIRSELRSHRTRDLSVPQFRILVFIKNNPDASISDVAEHIGLTLPTLSKMIDLLVARQWVTRVPCSEDRRRMQLGLTERGLTMIGQAQESTRASLAACFEGLPPEQLEQVTQAMQVLHGVFLTGHTIPSQAAQIK